MSMQQKRRKLMLGTIATASLPALPALAQAAPLRIGLLTVKTGPLAAGGIQMEQGITTFLKNRKYALAGRKVELVVADTGGNPAGAKTKVAELVERDRVDLLLGPFAAFELLAINDYVIKARIPILSTAAADDTSQRKADPWLIRTTATSSQVPHVIAHYIATETKVRRMAVIADDFAYGYEQIGGFCRVFEENGGKIIKRLYSPAATADYVPYLAQMTNVDGVFTGIGGGTVRFMRQYADLGRKATIPLFGGQTTLDDSLLKTVGDEAIGVVTASSYTASVDSPVNRSFVEETIRDYGKAPGAYAAGQYMNGMVFEAALAKTGGRVDDREALMAAMRGVALADSPRGPLGFDRFGNAVGNVYILRTERRGDALVNTIIKTYPKVSQFWTYDQAKYLAQPVYTRDYPQLKNLE
jgi:branched-chain amino acid transport system substrate-binding protein